MLLVRRLLSLTPYFNKARYHSLPQTIRQILSSPLPHSNGLGSHSDSGSPSTSTHSASLVDEISVTGYIKSIRKQRKVAFAVLADGSDARGLQAVFDEPILARSLANGTSVRLTGKLVPSPGSGQDRELQVKDVVILGSCDPDNYPIQKQNLHAEYLREHVHLRARTDRIAAMLRLRTTCARVLGKYFDSRDFLHTHTPILTSNDCEGAGEAFRITPVAGHPNSITNNGSSESEFFLRPAYLTVSSQLHLEALSWALGRVYTLGPCFRAERSMTGRHLAEFWMLEAEWWLGTLHGKSSDLEEICDVVEDAVKAVLQVCVTDVGAERHDMDVLWKDSSIPERRKFLERAITDGNPWKRMSYTEAIDILSAAHREKMFEFAPGWGKPLQSEHERYLAEDVVKGPVFVCDYPVNLKPFYMRVNDTSDGMGLKQTVACFDLLVPGVGELAGGSVREERAEVLETSLARMWKQGAQISPRKTGGTLSSDNDWKHTLGWYVDLRRYGGFLHGGFGMGFERLIGWISGIENVRECIPVPRSARNLKL